MMYPDVSAAQPRVTQVFSGLTALNRPLKTLGNVLEVKYSCVCWETRQKSERRHVPLRHAPRSDIWVNVQGLLELRTHTAL